MSLLQERRARANERLAALRTGLSGEAGRVRNDACVYVTGSYGRGEASTHSDLDWFLVTRTAPADAGSRGDMDQLNAALSAEVARLGIPSNPPSQELLHSADALVVNIGTDQDDAQNSLTARMLLLLESKPVLGDALYAEVIERVVQSYWRDFEGHEASFVPGFLVNDILRMWRTFCVNYEARTQSDPPEKKAKRALKNYKLKHSRLLTCYSALAYLLDVFRQTRTVAPAHVNGMIRLAPTERIEAIRSLCAPAVAQAGEALSRYENFLRNVDAPEEELVQRFLDRERRHRYRAEANALGDSMYELLCAIDAGSPLFRLLVV